ncbi:MAG TPA: hypothetical protein VKH37_02420, partial [Ferruginibacter sp.]|nr:hypothetical protein [Ferruginibacter sp.]
MRIAISLCLLLGLSTSVFAQKNTDTVLLKTKDSLLKTVTVTSKKPAIQFLPDKTVINPEATISNAGAT